VRRTNRVWWEAE